MISPFETAQHPSPISSSGPLLFSILAQYLEHQSSQSIAMFSSPVKDGRRVLGEKTPNASLKTQNRKETATTSPIKPTQDLKTSKISPVSSHAGQKRTIDQLDDVPDQSTPSKVEARSQCGGGFQIFRESTSSPEKKVHTGRQ